MGIILIKPTNKNYEKEKEMFLSFPRKLYKGKFYTQDFAMEKQILEGSHILSKEFEVFPFIDIMDGEVIGRCVLTYYPNDEKAYLGFFESTPDFGYSRDLFEAVFKKAKKDGKKEIIGPLNASFWIGYRMKTNKFDETYTNEPYNLDYYPLLWENVGFKPVDVYYSNQIRIPTSKDNDKKCQQRLKDALDKGYVFANPTFDNFEKCLDEVYSLFVSLYSSFPTYKPISRNEFKGMFSSLKNILDFSMVNLVYKDDELVAFFINIPNYDLSLYSLMLPNKAFIEKIASLKDMVKFLHNKKHAKEYVLIYMGVDPKHLGLGGALAEITKKELQKRKAKSIGALIMDGKVTNNYYKDLTVDRFQYMLYKKEL